MAPVEVSAEPYGRLPGYVLVEGLGPEGTFILHGLFWLALAIGVIALVDLILRGRFRTISATLARMLAALGPLLGIYGGASILMGASLKMDTHLDPAAIGQSAFLVAIGALCGCVGVVLAAVLRIVPVKPKHQPGDRASSD